MGLKRFIASRLSRRGNGIALVSVALSVAVMIVAVAVTSGFRNEIRAKATGFMGSVVLVPPGQTPFNESYPFDGQLSYIDELRAIPGVESVSGVGYRSGIIKAGDEIHGLYFKGVDSLFDFNFFRSSLVSGDLPNLSGRVSSDILISKRLADKLHFAQGDRLTAYFVGEEVRARNFTVCGIYDVRLEEMDETFAVIDLRQIRRVSGWNPDDVSCVEIRITPETDIDKALYAVEEVEMFHGNNENGLFALSVKQIFSNLFDWLSLLDLNVVMVLVLMMLVAGFNMISALLIILFRKIPMIGTLKSLGMTGSQVTRTFLLRASSIVLRGMLWGDVLALVLCFIQDKWHVIKLDPESYFVSYAPVHIEWLSVILVNAISFAIIMLLLSVTSRFISRVDPARTMRAE